MRDYKKLVIKLDGRVASKKNSKRIVCRGSKPRVLPSKAYETFEESALWQLKQYRMKFEGEITVDYVFKMKGKLDADLDNMMASVNDVIQKAGIIDDDKNITSVSAKKVAGGDDFKTQITILQFIE